nr:hypothetical protein [Streptomyces qinglanensis]
MAVIARSRSVRAETTGATRASVTSPSSPTSSATSIRASSPMVRPSTVADRLASHSRSPRQSGQTSERVNRAIVCFLRSDISSEPRRWIRSKRCTTPS